MKKENNSSESEYLNDLKDRLNKESIQDQFRTQKIGGFNQEDVTNYILYIEEKFKKLEKELNSERKRSAVYQDKLEKETKENEILKKRLDDHIHNKIDHSMLFPINDENRESSEETAQMSRMIQQLKDENSALKASLNKLEVGGSSEANQDSEIYKLYEEMRQELEHVRDLNQNLSIDLGTSRQDYIELQEEICDAQEMVKEKQKVIEQLENDIKRMERNSRIEQDKLLASIRKLDEEIYLYRGKVKELEEAISSNESRSEEITKYCNELKKELEFEQSRYEEQKLILEEDEQLFERLINEEREELEKAREQAVLLREENRSLKHKIMEMEKVLSLYEIRNDHSPNQKILHTTEKIEYDVKKNTSTPGQTLKPDNNDLIKQIEKEFERALLDLQQEGKARNKPADSHRAKAKETKLSQLLSKETSEKANANEKEKTPGMDISKKPGSDKRVTDRLNRI